MNHYVDIDFNNDYEVEPLQSLSTYIKGFLISESFGFIHIA